MSEHIERRVKWDRESVIQEASLYDRPVDFESGSKGAYRWAVRNQMMGALFPDRNTSVTHTEDSVRELAKKYAFRKDFRTGVPAGAYEFARKNNLLDELFPVKRTRKSKRTIEGVKVNASKCDGAKDFRNRFPGDYSWAWREGVLPVLFPKG